MKVFVRHSKLSGPSGRKIAATITRLEPSWEVLVGNRVPSHTEGYKIINWGSTTPLNYLYGRVINPAFAVSVATDKIETFIALEENGIQVPGWERSYDWPQAGRNGAWQTLNGEIRYPVLARRKRGKGGTDIRRCESYRDSLQYINTHDFFAELIDKKFEFRVHVAFGEAVKVSQKVFDPSKGKPFNPTIWNYRKGFIFVKPRLEYIHNSSEFLDRIKGFGVASIEACELDFGAVDIIADEDQVISVLEVNTAPGVKTRTSAEAYCKAFVQHLSRSTS